MNVVYYASGKLVLQGRELREFLERWLPEAAPKPPEVKDAMIGADEAGKGDYFGPLVAAAVYLEPDVARFLDEVPLRDSKTISAAEIESGAEMLRRIVPYEIVSIGPKKYNELYAKFRNVNSLLAWAHKTAICALVKRTGCKKILLDKFADERVMERAFGADCARTSTSRCARRPSPSPRSPPPRSSRATPSSAACGGSRKRSASSCRSAPAIPSTGPLRALLAQKGEAILSEVAKMHFKTTTKNR